MNVHVYANCWNEMRMLPFFMRHYEPFVDRFIVLDDGSTDGSVEFLNQQAKVKVIHANRKDTSYARQSYLFFNQAWKDSRSTADWIITCNIDEHIYHKNIEKYLHQCLQNGITLLPADGYEMVALSFPSIHGKLCDEVRLGAPTDKLKGPSGMLNKIMAFNPNAIEEMAFNTGRHQAKPTGNVVYPSSVELKLLHYKFLGMDYLEKRYAELKTGLISADLKIGLGGQYMWDQVEMQRNFATVVSNSCVVVPIDLLADARLNLSFLPFKFKLRLVDLIAKRRSHALIKLMLFIYNTAKKR